ncbi:QueT transporter family protein [Weissella coleopterorum]|uniref:QueT transporter family protein n=1 Tax=Weissella coleopterorum TaxID=2714949 RepID=A0A6G8B1B4_9LACO|nr:QueT transporter family protein [Weissella coleopterorum]QIL51104.1 QueT transporter family protein [Weissella coleopterorum]
MHVKTKWSAREIALMSIVAGLYVAVTWLVAPFAYGQIQLRLSEGFNHLAIFNKRYIIAISIGVFIANLTSPLGIIDVIFGTLGTLVMTSLSYWLAQKVETLWLKLTLSVLIDTVMMWSVALEQYWIFKLPFWLSYGWLAAGEFCSLLIGAILIYFLQKRVDLSN